MNHFEIPVGDPLISTGDKIGLGYRAYEVEIKRRPSGEAPLFIRNNNDLMEVMKGYYEGIDREIVLAVCLDDVNKLVGVYEVSKGGRSEVELDLMTLFRAAVMLNAQKVVVVHNHPTGDIRPSDGDVRAAKAAFMIGSLLDIDVSDNIVLNAETFEWKSVHADEGFRSWMNTDLMTIATLLAGSDLTEEQRVAADEIRREMAFREKTEAGYAKES